MIEGTCPQCGRVYHVDDRYAGRTGQCKACGAAVTVPVPGQPVADDDGLAAGTPAAEPAPGPPKPRPKPRPPRPRRAPPPAPDSSLPARSSPVIPLPGADQAPAQPEESPSPTGEAPQPASHEPAAAPEEPAGAEPPSRHAQSDGEPQQAQGVDRTAEPDAASAQQGAPDPTAARGSWLAGEITSARPRDEAEDEIPQSAPSGDEVLATSKLIAGSSQPAIASPLARPVALAVACIVLGLLGLGFAGIFARGGAAGMAVAGIAVVLAALGVVRLWAGYRDGLIPAVLFCLSVPATVLFIALVEPTAGFTIPAIALLAGSGVALLLTVLAAVLPNGSLFLNQHR